MKLSETTFEYEGETLTFQLGQYDNGRLAIQIVDTDGMPYAKLTVNIPEYFLPEDQLLVKDYSENTPIANTIFEKGILVKTGIFAESGYIQAPVCTLGEGYEIG